MLYKLILSPFLPYWLRIRYQFHMLFSDMRVNRLQRKYERIVAAKQWEKEEWSIVDNEASASSSSASSSSAASSAVSINRE
jgi:hypothetical protein